MRIGSTWPAWAFGILAIAASVLTVMIIRPNMEMRGSVARLAILQPLALPTTLPTDPRGDESTATTRREAIAAYADKDYHRVEALLIAEVKARSADADALLLLGSALLLSDRPAESREPLQAAGRLATSDQVREEALWQQAQASLLLGRRVEATAFLQEVAKTGVAHPQEARAQLAQLSALR